MKTITLTPAQRKQILSELATIHNENGDFNVTIDIEGLTIEAKSFIDIEGHTEDGTGAYIEDSRIAHIELAAWTEDSEEVEIDDDTIDALDEYLNAA